MAKMNSKFKYMFDAAPSVSLLGQSDAAHTASFVGTTLTLDKLDGYWNQPIPPLADQTFAIVINVTAVDHTTGDETYKLDLVASSNGFTAKTVVGTIGAIPATGQYVILIDADTMAQVVAGVTAIRIEGTLAGTTPSIAAFAWMTGIQC